jgi:hypothetical protein
MLLIEIIINWYLLTIHFYTQITIHIKHALLLDSPLVQIPHIHNNQGINFYVLSSMYSIIIVVKLYTHANNLYPKIKNNVVHAHTSS